MLPAIDKLSIAWKGFYMKTVYALYSKVAYESCTLKGIFFNRKDAELEVLKFNPNSYDSIEIDEIVTRYPECDMYAVVYNNTHYFISDSFKTATEESNKRSGSKVESFSIR